MNYYEYDDFWIQSEDCCGKKRPIKCKKDVEKKRCDCNYVSLGVAAGSIGPLPLIIPVTDPISVVSVMVNTKDMQKATVLLNFTGIIGLPAGAAVTLNFQVTRSTNEGVSVPVGSTYTFTRTAGELEADSFAFLYKKEIFNSFFLYYYYC